MIRDNSSFDDALTSVQILLLERTGDGYEENLEASSKFVYETGSTVIFTDRKKTIEKFGGLRNFYSVLFTQKTTYPPGLVKAKRSRNSFSGS